VTSTSEWRATVVETCSGGTGFLADNELRMDSTSPEPVSLDILCPSIGDTEKLGRALGRLLFPGAVVGLVGPLGAGKTLLVRAIAEGLGISDPRLVTSPTFVLIQEYPARLPIYHFDVYRLKHGSEFVDLGALEYMAGRGVCLIEWADRVKSLLPPEYLSIELENTGPQSRKIRIHARGTPYRQLLESLRASTGA
jgi:tRNA threonylcarbamoyladenosine biosynthesis protein TsaE